MNPYEVPHLDVGSGKPLSPLKHQGHEDYYVAVDHSDEAFEQFKSKIGDAAALKRDGRLVVVVGQEHCGKTSLLNRCAAWVRSALTTDGSGGGGPATEVHVLNLVDACERNKSVLDRQQGVYSCVVDELERRDQLTAEQVKELREREDKLDRGYRYLGLNLRPEALVVVLLPPTELLAEVVEYARFTQRRLLFMVETAEVDLIERKWSEVADVSSAEPLRLKVSLLKEGDGWEFVKSRHRLHPKGDACPKVTESAVQKVIETWKPSIGQLQTLLYGIYNEMLVEQRAEARTEVSFDDIKDLFFSMNRTGRGFEGHG